MSHVYSRERLEAELGKNPVDPYIKEEDVLELLDAIAAVGRTAEGGFTRPPYSAEDREAKAIFRSHMEQIGLSTWEDAAGNLFGRYEGTDPDAAVVLTGSHLDSVPNGGAFDGPLGCVSSLLAVKALKEAGIRPNRSIDIVVFMDEEGSRFQNGLYGSRVVMGDVTPEQLLAFSDDKGIELVDAMAEQGYDYKKIGEAKRNAADIHAFIELHIEQGKQLEEAGVPIGVVNGIAGPSFTNFTFIGETDHAGNTPMTNRKDANAAASEFVLAAEEVAPTISETAVATVGRMIVHPCGSNVIAGKVELTLDARDIHEGNRDKMVEELMDRAKAIATKRGLTVNIETAIRIPPVPIHEEMQTLIRNAAETAGTKSMPIVSGAGHDAMNIGRHVPVGMIFVPSHRGKSHSPEEWTSLPDCVRGVVVLRNVLLELAEG